MLRRRLQRCAAFLVCSCLGTFLADLFFVGALSAGVSAEELFSPLESRFSFDPSPLLRACERNNTDTLWRYVTGNPRWEVRKEEDWHKGGSKRFAIRMEDVPDFFSTKRGFQTSLNGFYSTEKRQTRVLISFRGRYGYGHENRGVTSVVLNPGQKLVHISPVLERADKHGYNGHTSYLIFELPCQLSVEIMEQQLDLDRPFTRTAVKQLSDEIQTALAHGTELEAHGRFSNAQLYPVVAPERAKLEVLDQPELGIYVVDAWISQRQQGEAYVRVFREADNKEVFRRYTGDESLRSLGFDPTGKNLFRYTSEVTLSEGDWSSQYKARFELWVKNFDGSAPQKVLEMSRLVNGWQR